MGSWAIANGRGIVTLRPRSGEQILQVNKVSILGKQEVLSLAEPEREMSYASFAMDELCMIVEKKCSRTRILHWTKGGNANMQKVEKDHVLCGVTPCFHQTLLYQGHQSGTRSRFFFFLFKKKKTLDF